MTQIARYNRMQNEHLPDEMNQIPNDVELGIKYQNNTFHKSSVRIIIIIIIKDN